MACVEGQSCWKAAYWNGFGDQFCTIEKLFLNKMVYFKHCSLKKLLLSCHLENAIKSAMKSNQQWNNAIKNNQQGRQIKSPKN